MMLNPVFVFTHDSIALGQDGPTHQPIERLGMLWMIPNMEVWRPCDTVEAFVDWRTAIQYDKIPTSLVLSRQNLAFQSRDAQQIKDVARGGYVLRREDGPLHAVIIATGFEVGVASESQATLASRGVFARVVSMPSTYQFDRQGKAYEGMVVPDSVVRILVKAGVTDYWHKRVGFDGAWIGIDTFGKSAPAEVLFEHFNITAGAIVASVMKHLPTMAA